MYKNGTLFGRRNVSAWPYYDDGGYIGMGFISASGARVDDFGGETISGGGFMGMIAAWFDGGDLSVEGESLDPGTESNSFDLQVDNASIFWQGIPLKSGKEAAVTFTHTDKSVAWQKPLSNGVWGEIFRKFGFQPHA